MIETILKSTTDGQGLSMIESKVNNPKACILIHHGMCEHKERYIDFIKYLNSIGYNAYIYDMRGHGKSLDVEKTLGYFGDTNGDKTLVQDLVDAVNYVKGHNVGLKLYLIAHSMGTIVTRNFLQQHDTLIDKVILTGAPTIQKLAKTGVLIASTIEANRGTRNISELLTSLSTGQFNKTIKNPKTPHDWISFNEDNVKAYSEDPLCGFEFTISGYKALFKLTANMANSKLYKCENEYLPIMILVGDSDACVGGNKGLSKSIKVLKKAGYKNINSYTFNHMRHEILLEVEKEKVYVKVKEFLEEEIKND